jgi:hypothetical protein
MAARAAAIVGNICRAENPADLPVEQPRHSSGYQSQDSESGWGVYELGEPGSMM